TAERPRWACGQGPPTLGRAEGSADVRDTMGPRGSMQDGEPSAGDPIPPDCRPIEVHVAELKQLFNAIDPSPFRERDLDPNAEEFIVEWGRELPRDVPLPLI